MAATEAAIRDRIRTLIAAIAPTSHTADKFRAYLNEGGGNFADWVEANPQGCARRFLARAEGTEDPPEVSNTDTDLRHFVIVLQVAYPQTGRYGADQALDRDDVIDQDWGLINGEIGIYGRANFSGAHDCTPLGAERSVVRGNGADLLEVSARFLYYRTIT